MSGHGHDKTTRRTIWLLKVQVGNYQEMVQLILLVPGFQPLSDQFAPFAPHFDTFGGYLNKSEGVPLGTSHEIFKSTCKCIDIKCDEEIHSLVSGIITVYRPIFNFR